MNESSTLVAPNPHAQPKRQQGASNVVGVAEFSEGAQRGKLLFAQAVI
jgi:hypothetical protein